MFKHFTLADISVLTVIWCINILCGIVIYFQHN